MHTVSVRLAERGYPIFIGAGLLDGPAPAAGAEGFVAVPAANGTQKTKVLIVSDETVAPLYMEKARGFLRGQSVTEGQSPPPGSATGVALASPTPPQGGGDYAEIHELVLADGERHKHLGTVGRIYDCLLRHRFDRSGILVALGGGVVGDITGFAAATYQRGVDFLQIPTTLLAQVDSSVGGKTGVNHPLPQTKDSGALDGDTPESGAPEQRDALQQSEAMAKNMVGAFHQPRAVFIDTEVLRTLPPRQLRAGAAEAVKYGLLGDVALFDWLADNSGALLSVDRAVTGEAVRRCCEAKAAVVAADEKEAGRRALLNLGHTFGHAIETATGGRCLHGEAVAMGMVMAADLSKRLGLLTAAAARRVREVLEGGFGLAPVPPPIPEARYMEIMSADKKAEGGRLRFVLLRAIGDAFVTAEVEPAALRATLNAGEDLCR